MDLDEEEYRATRKLHGITEEEIQREEEIRNKGKIRENKVVASDYVKENYIHKDKIREKLTNLQKREEMEINCYGYATDSILAITVLEELLGE